MLSGHTKAEWRKLFDNTEALVRSCKTAIVHCDGEQAIKDAFNESEVYSTMTKQTCTRHAAWTTAATVGKQAAEAYHKRCVTASCEAEFEYKCKELREEYAAEGRHDDENQIMIYQRDRKDAIFDFDPVMMNGQLATGIIEGVWAKLKGHRKRKRTLLMLVSAMIRLGCELSQSGILNNHAITKFANQLHTDQFTRAGDRKDAGSFTILKRAAQKLSFYAIRVGRRLQPVFTPCSTPCYLMYSPRARRPKVIERRLLLVPEMTVQSDNLVYHKGNKNYQFMPQRGSNGKWTCWSCNPDGDDEPKMCWQNRLYGLPCSHILSVWCQTILSDDKVFDFKDVKVSVHKMYRRATYNTGGSNTSHHFATYVL